uniref:ataxin-7-like protein 3 isoform X2 n=1 Tax=Myxine glutinosa TaxID=7769 RepID=UPI00358FE1E4
MEGLAQDIFAELIDDVCLGLCFEVHRSAKCGFFFLDDVDAESMQEFEIVDKAGVDIFGQVYNQCKNRDCECPNCGRTIAAARFAPHLEKCLGMGRNSSRLANRRLANSNNSSLNKSESDPEDNDDINDNDWSYSSEKKAKKRKADKNPNSPRRAKSLKHKNGEIGSGISDIMKQCGVISEHTKKMCTRSHRCPQHTDDQRRASALETEEVDVDGYDGVENTSYEPSCLWDATSDTSPTDSVSSKNSESPPQPPISCGYDGCGISAKDSVSHGVADDADPEGTTSSDSKKNKKSHIQCSPIPAAQTGMVACSGKKKKRPPTPGSSP